MLICFSGYIFRSKKRNRTLAKHTLKTLLRRITRAGFDKEFVRSAILPEWWSEECLGQSALLPDIEIRIARFLGIPLSQVSNPEIPLSAPQYTDAQLRRVRAVDSDRLAPAIHSALRIGAAVARNLRDSVPPNSIPNSIPESGLDWRDQFLLDNKPLTLEVLLKDLWTRGIPVAPLDVLPSPSFQGISCIVEGRRPVILLGHRLDEPGRVAFIVAHEAGHIAAEDCAPNRPVVDEDEEIVDDSLMERLADEFATNVIVGGGEVPSIEGTNHKILAQSAWEAEKQTGVAANYIIFAWASRTHDYAKATMAVKALYRGSGARRLLRQYFNEYVDIENASESDRALLECIRGDQG